MPSVKSIYEVPLKIGDNKGLLSDIAADKHRTALGAFYRRLIDQVNQLEHGELGRHKVGMLRSYAGWRDIAHEFIFYLWLKDNGARFSYKNKKGDSNLDFHISNPYDFFIEVTLQKPEDEKNKIEDFAVELIICLRVEPPNRGANITVCKMIGSGRRIDFIKAMKEVDSIAEEIRDHINGCGNDSKSVFTIDKGGYIVNIEVERKSTNDRVWIRYSSDVPEKYDAQIQSLVSKIVSKHGQISQMNEKVPKYLGITFPLYDDGWLGLDHIKEGVFRYYKEWQDKSPLSGIIYLEPYRIHSGRDIDEKCFYEFEPNIFRFKGKQPQIPLKAFEYAKQYSVGDRIRLLRSGARGNIGFTLIGRSS